MGSIASIDDCHQCSAKAAQRDEGLHRYPRSTADDIAYAPMVGYPLTRLTPEETKATGFRWRVAPSGKTSFVWGHYRNIRSYRDALKQRARNFIFQDRVVSEFQARIGSISSHDLEALKDWLDILIRNCIGHHQQREQGHAGDLQSWMANMVTSFPQLRPLPRDWRQRLPSLLIKRRDEKTAHRCLAQLFARSICVELDARIQNLPQAGRSRSLPRI